MCTLIFCWLWPAGWSRPLRPPLLLSLQMYSQWAFSPRLVTVCQAAAAGCSAISLHPVAASAKTKLNEYVESWPRSGKILLLTKSNGLNTQDWRSESQLQRDANLCITWHRDSVALQQIAVQYWYNGVESSSADPDNTSPVWHHFCEEQQNILQKSSISKKLYIIVPILNNYMSVQELGSTSIIFRWWR